MKKYQSPETIDMSDLLNEIGQKTLPESVYLIQVSLAKANENTNLNAYQISINQEDNDWNDPLNDHLDNY